jgi:uncharacterized membrane protein
MFDTFIMEHWKKGGIIGIIVCAIVFVVYILNISSLPENASLIAFPGFVIVLFFFNSVLQFDAGYSLSWLFSIAITFVFYFFIGALIGEIILKIKKKK